MEKNWQHWFIMSKDGIFTLGVVHGDFDYAEQYAKSIYKSDYKLMKDDRNDNHPFWKRYHEYI